MLLGALLVLAVFGPAPLPAQTPARLTFRDLMQVRQIRDPSISRDGRWVALAAEPDRGDGEVIVYEVDGARRFTVPGGAAPEISPDGRWVAIRLEPSFEARETLEPDDRPRPALALLDTESGEIRRWEEVRSFAFSADGRWLARHGYPQRSPQAGSGSGRAGRAGNPAEEEEAEPAERARRDTGTALVLLDLGTGVENEVSAVTDFRFDGEGRWLAYAVATSSGEGDGVYVKSLEGEGRVRALVVRERARVAAMAWWAEGGRLAWVIGEEGEDGNVGPGELGVWDAREPERVRSVPPGREGWILPSSTRLEWSEDGERLFYGARPDPGTAGDTAAPGPGEGEEDEQRFDPYDLDAILRDRGVDVWNTDDPLINPNQKKVWSREQDRTYWGVFHLGEDKAVQLGDSAVQLRGVPVNPLRALATSELPYRKESTWTGGADDVYIVDLADGGRTLVTRRFESEGSAANQWLGMRPPALDLSPGGRFVVWFQGDDWHLFDAESGETRVLTEGLEVPFYDLDHDYPNARGGHGIGGWLEGDRAVLIHDKYDVWQFPTDGGRPVNLTRGEGRRRGLVLRVLAVDPDARYYRDGGPIYLASFDEGDKSFGFFRTRAGRGGLEPLLDEEKRFRLLAKAEDTGRVLYTREDYDEFPDLWVADMDFSDPTQVSDVNPGLTKRFAWGTAELVKWTSDDGIPLEGVVIKPSNYEPGKRYPVLTYFYRFFSQRLHEFNEPVVNHRPSFPVYASDGYVIFLPDVRFEVGRPGLSALKSVVPGVKKLVDMGLADPDALGLHGHSWSGYTTAFIVTQTHLFAAAVAGAPVANMTSAYGGIRWGTGLARQFQYEKGQSRLSGSLWEARSDYIENSPLFYADRVDTPLLIMHGDEDDAVPWYQSIELYLALRRNGKKAVFLQYRGEPHHPQRYANKLDYSIRMKEFFDHFLKGAPAPDWWTKGVPYNGK